MIGGYLSKIGGALAGVVGPVHDTLWSETDNTNPAKWSQIQEYGSDTELTWSGENMKNTVSYYVGGTAVIAAAVTALAFSLKKPKMRYIRTKARRTYRRRK